MEVIDLKKYYIAHFSDLHIGDDNEYSVFGDIRNNLIDDIERLLIRTKISPDAMVITGDLINKNNLSIYPKAIEYCVRLSQVLGLKKNQVVIVPGNHDVPKLDDDKVLKPEEIINRIGTKDDCHEYWNNTHKDRFLEYFNLVNEVTGDEKYLYTAMAGAVRIVETSRGPIQFALLNSAWAAKGGYNDYGHIMVGKWQLQNISEQLRKNEANLNLVLAHHPMEWFWRDDQNLFETHMCNTRGIKYHAFLRGHMHTATIRNISTPDGMMAVLASGGGFPEYDERKYVPNFRGFRYAIYEFDMESGLIRAMVRVTNQYGHFNLDTELYREEQDADGFYKIRFLNNFEKDEKSTSGILFRKERYPVLPDIYKKYKGDESATLNSTRKSVSLVNTNESSILFSRMTRRPKVLFLTTLVSVNDEVVQRLKSVEDIPIRDKVYEYGQFTSHNTTWDVWVGMVGMGSLKASMDTERAISYFSPDLIILVGIAARTERVSVGDVVVAQSIHHYESGKINGESVDSHIEYANQKLIKSAKTEARRNLWTKHIQRSKSKNKPRAHVGMLVSTEKISNFNALEVNQFHQNALAMAMDMEGRGVLLAANSNNTDALIVCGITDTINGFKKDDYRKLASNNACAFAIEVLSQLNTNYSTDIHAEQKTKILDKNKSLYSMINTNAVPIKGNYFSELNSFIAKIVPKLYFARPFWEVLLNEAISLHERVFLYGLPGVGKTTLMANLASNGHYGLYAFDISSGATLDVIEGIKSLYKYCASQCDDLAPLPDICTRTELLERLEYLASTSNRTCEAIQYTFLFDGIDELRSEQFKELLSFLNVVKDVGIKIVFSSRNATIKTQLEKSLGSVYEIELTTLQENEILEWLKFRFSGISNPSQKLIAKIYAQSEGNFIYLNSIPKFSTENEMLEFLNRSSKTLEELFDTFLSRLSELELDIISLTAFLPLGVNKDLLQELYQLTDIETDRVFESIGSLLKVNNFDNYVLFHGAFVEYIKQKMSKRLDIVVRIILSNIDKYESYIRIDQIPIVFEKASDINGLATWITKYVENTEEWIRDKDRFVIVSSISNGFEAVSKMNMEIFFKILPAIEEVIYKNFLLIFSWRLFGPFKEIICNDNNKKHKDLWKGLNSVKLACGNAFYAEANYYKAREIYKEVYENVNYDDPLTKVRAANLIGLTLENQQEYESAKSYFTSIIDLLEHEDNIWKVYALANRGRIHNWQNNKDGFHDISEAIKTLKRIRNSKRVKKNIYDYSYSEFEYDNTLLVLYDNVLEGYMANRDKPFASVYGDINNHVAIMNKLIKMLLSSYKDQVQSYTTTGRTLLNMSKFYFLQNMTDKAREYIDLAEKCYLNKKNQARLVFHQDMLGLVNKL